MGLILQYNGTYGINDFVMVDSGLMKFATVYKELPQKKTAKGTTLLLHCGILKLLYVHSNFF
jgi:hypothetical protein